MSLIQIVIGAALGCLAAEGVLYGVRSAGGWAQSGAGLRQIGRLRRLAPGRSSTFTTGFVRYAGVIGVSAALITLGVWAVGDYWAADRAPVSVNAFGPAPGPASVAPGIAENASGPAQAPQTRPVAVAAAGEDTDPYIDPDFRVHRAAHRPGTDVTLKETLLQRSEARARADLLREIQQHAQRSQYDCEALDRANKYLRAGLDVWGFTAWQLKHFPAERYTGATLARCKDIKNVIDPSWIDLRSAVAQQSRP